LAAPGLQDEATRLAVEVARRDGVDIRPRIGPNSGQAIAGEIGSGALGDTARRFRRQSPWLTTRLSNAT
jgi:adenylate cyclase